MSAYYLDTSALVKRYIQETGTDWVSNLTHPSVGHDLFLGRLAGPELIAAVTRRARGGHLLAEESTRAIANFRADWQGQYNVIEFDETIADLAMTLAAKHGLRGYDSVHIATALRLQEIRESMEESPVIFVSADVEQLDAARKEGLAVENPNDYPETPEPD
ncbi:MAG: type II toxin-antitoxin system VapC family toxin [Chloroflexi bacterium]|nr:type II toxin-antitoxin system VapC family toxin [Chloroflexota bacterium]